MSSTRGRRQGKRQASAALSEEQWDSHFDDEWASENGLMEDTDLLKLLLEHAAAFRYTRLMNAVQEILLARGNEGKLPVNSLSARYFCMATVEKALSCYRYNHSLQVVADFLRCGLSGITDELDDSLDDLILAVRQQQCLEHLVFAPRSSAHSVEAAGMPENELQADDISACITDSQIKSFSRAIEEYFPWEHLDEEIMPQESLEKYKQFRDPLVQLYQTLTKSKHWEEFSHTSAPIHPPRNWRGSIEEWHIARQHWQKNAFNAIHECRKAVMSYSEFKETVFKFLSETYSALPQPQLLVSSQYLSFRV
eukprot:gb/GECG01011054.1/.p1 GENE.gb/GECG01011054.1/~~gb/GECG01011054.1/.p1  ORF type:complete len:309 (+),score=45.86 gb/GECG01011054.1/:1-927(+)